MNIFIYICSPVFWRIALKYNFWSRITGSEILRFWLEWEFHLYGHLQCLTAILFSPAAWGTRPGASKHRRPCLPSTRPPAAHWGNQYLSTSETHSWHILEVDCKHPKLWFSGCKLKSPGELKKYWFLGFTFQDSDLIVLIVLRLN